MCDEILGFLRIWSQLLKKSLMENFIFYAVPCSNLGKSKSIYPRKFLLGQIAAAKKNGLTGGFNILSLTSLKELRYIGIPGH